MGLDDGVPEEGVSIGGPAEDFNGGGGGVTGTGSIEGDELRGEEEVGGVAGGDDERVGLPERIALGAAVRGEEAVEVSFYVVGDGR